MELKLVNGDYCPDGLGGMEQVSGLEELIQRVHYRLVARRGSFPLLPNMGSRLHLVMREKPSARQRVAEGYVQEALEEEDVTVDSVVLSPEGDKLLITVFLTWRGETVTVTEEL